MWCAISILSMTMGRRVYVDQSYYQVHPMLYICLVGRQGLRKSFAKDQALNMFTSVFPDSPIGASVMSREKIVERMASDESRRTFLDENGAGVEYVPTNFFVNELKNFLSINPGAMIEFLTDIYDTKYFASDTLKHGLQPIINPCVNIIACETPRWLIEKLKLNIIAGGFSRRMLYAYEIIRPPRITFPKITPEMEAAEEWCKAHLRKISKIAGPFKWENEVVKDYFDKWFKALPNQDDEVLEGFYEAKDTLVLKVAMGVAMAEENPRLLLTMNVIQEAIAHVESLEDNLPKLSIAVGRNELALPTQTILQLLESNEGWMLEKQLKVVMEKDLSGPEQFTVMRQLRETDRAFIENVILPNKTTATVVMTRATYVHWKKNGTLRKIE